MQDKKNRKKVSGGVAQLKRNALNANPKRYDSIKTKP